ncbi:MAG: lipopolysaccharide heptosyltransferase II [Candidatus Omnitrophica bacterium]|nr:lipopolysaccharide heptosyltransferase II [Candidatus Omnitrophota bacterium]
MSRRILIRAPNWLGDAIMATGAIDLYHQRNPNDIITLLGTPGILTVFSSSYNPYNLFPYDREQKDAGLLGLARMGGMLHNQFFDAGYLLTNSFSSALMFYIGRIPERIGYRGHWRSRLLSEPVDPIPILSHQAQQYAYLLTRDPEALPPPKIRVSPEEREKARQVLEQEEFLGKIRIGMAIGAAYGPAKCWPAEYFAELARNCVKTLDARILLFGAKNEMKLVREVKQMAGKGVLDLSGKTTLRQLLALLQQCRIVIANDSGVMHAATAVKTPVVALFGSTDPVKTGPLGSHSRVLYENVDCSPCFDRTCRYGHYECLRLITPQSALKSVNDLLIHQEAK